jgi:hypothetical protein
MSRAFLFWFLMLLWLVFSVWWWWPVGGAAGGAYLVLGVPLLIFVLFAILGWHVFGSPVKG